MEFILKFIFVLALSLVSADFIYRAVIDKAYGFNEDSIILCLNYPNWNSSLICREYPSDNVITQSILDDLVKNIKHNNDTFEVLTTTEINEK